MLFVVVVDCFCVLYVMCWLLFVGRRSLLFVACCCVLFVVCWLLFVVRCLV